MQRTTGTRRALRLLGVAGIALTAMALNGCDPGPVATADYQFNNTLRACGNDAPVLTKLGTSSFATESVDGKSWKVLRFNDNSGVRLSPTTGEVSSSVYTIVVLFRITTPAGFNRLVDFKNGTSDTGLYDESGSLRLYSESGGAATPIRTSFVQVALTRNSSKSAVGYVDGVKQFTVVDDGNFGVISNSVLRFFQDNTSGGATTEASPGAVARIRLFNKALTQTEVQNLGQLPTSPCATT